MPKKQILLTFALMSVLTLGLAAPVFARGGGDDGSTSTNSDAEDNHMSEGDDELENEDETETEVEDTNDDATDDSDSRRIDRKERQMERIDQKRTEMKQRFEAMKTERKEKLDGKRLELCQKRQDKINEHLDKSAEHSKEKLVVFQRIEEGVKAFYIDKNLSSEQYDAAVALADEKEAAAIAAIDAVAAQEFVCSAIDGAKPSGVIRESVKARHAALQSYRESVKDLIKVVKQALKASTETATEGTN